MLTECEDNGPVESPPTSPPPQVDGCGGNVDSESSSGAEMLSTARHEHEAEINRLKQETRKEKETMVMRYANSEKEILKLRKEIGVINKQVQNLVREVDALNKRNRMLGSERERLINMVDAKVCDVQSLQKECDRLREDNSSKDFKIKWIQSKIAGESDAHKETQAKLEKCAAELKEAMEESQRMKQDCQDMINSYAPPPEIEIPAENGRVSPPQKFPVESAHGAMLNPGQKEIEILNQKYRSLIEENNSLSCRVQQLQQERLDMEHKLSRLHESNADHLHQIASLQSDLASAESLRIQFLSEHERVVTLQGEFEQLRQCNLELLSDMAVCRRKEAELLSYTQQVTGKNVHLQSEFSSVEAKSLFLEEENQCLLSRIEELEKQVKSSEKSVLQEKKYSAQERQSLLKEMERQKDDSLFLKRRLVEVNGDILLLKKKHETTLRELTRELKVAMRFAKEGTNGSGDGMSQSSRTSSSTSLNNLEASQHTQKSSDNHESEPPVIPDRQALVDKIVELKELLATHQEKNEFLREHMKELQETAQRQRKIILFYAMSQDAGAMSSDVTDQNKAEFVKHGGIMASLYAAKPPDEGLTLDLSLEISRKLQALLEDTLLKNITLKGNLSTLGEENSRLTDIIRRLTAEKP